MFLFSRLISTLRSLRYIFSSKSNLLLKITALEYQLALFKQKHPRPKISPVDRILWVWLRRLWFHWKEVLYFVKPETVKRWHKRGFKLYWRFISKRGIGKGKGRPPLDMKIIEFIAHMVKENVTWRAPRIHGELLKLGFRVSERTVSRYLRMFRTTNSQQSKWMTFLRNQGKGIAAMDFVIEPTLLFKRLFVLFFISHDRRELIHFAVTYHPTALWVSHQIREAFSLDKWSHIKYMIHDRDAIFSKSVIQTLKGLSIESVRTSYKSPWQNGIAERWVGSCRRELLDHVIILNKRHLEILLSEYVQYYNEVRTHYSLCKDPPIKRPIMERQSEDDKVIAIPRVGGLHHKYVWQSAA
jgi:putative transposase